jgi:hypothetical protein
MAPKMHAGKKQSRRMKGGMTTGQWGTAVYGDSSSQQAVGAGSNVIRMHDPNSVVAAPQLKGGRKQKGGDLSDYISNPFASAPAPAEEEGILDKLSGLNPFADNNAVESSPAAEEAPPAAEEAPLPPAMGGKGKRKSATKRRKSHKKKGKSSKKRAHKRH